jgi:hypothetical protein
MWWLTRSEATRRPEFDALPRSRRPIGRRTGPDGAGRGRLCRGQLCAEQLFDESETLLRAAGSRWNPAANLSIRVVTTAMRGDHAQSIALLRESLALALRLRDTQTTAYNLEGLAGASPMLGEGRRAARLCGATEALRERTGSVIGLATLRELRLCMFSAVGLANPRQRPPGA